MILSRCRSSRTLSSTWSVIKLSYVQIVSKSTKTSSKELTEKNTSTSLKYSERTTNKYFFGPLHESSRKRNQRLVLEKWQGKSHTPIENIVKSNLKRNESIDYSDYERFAKIYASEPYLNKAHLKINNDICESYSAAKSEKKKVRTTSRKSTSKMKIKNDFKKLFYNNLIDLSQSRFTDVPHMVEVSKILDFPLYNDKRSLISSVRTSDTQPLSVPYSDVRKNVPSVSKILQATMSKENLVRLRKWKAKMIALMGEEEFKNYQEGLFAEGSILHNCIQGDLLRSTPPSKEDMEKVAGYWSSVCSIVDKAKEENCVSAVESAVVHPHLHYMGVMDCVAVINDTPVVVEWKTSTSKKKKASATYDNPVQLAAYLGALQFDPNYQHLTEVQCCLLVVCYSNGDECDFFLLSKAEMESYWELWKQRLITYWSIMSQEKPPAVLREDQGTKQTLV